MQTALTAEIQDTPLSPATLFVALSRFTAWHRSHLHHESHRGIPKGLKLDPKATRMRYFEHVCS